MIVGIIILGIICLSTIAAIIKLAIDNHKYRQNRLNELDKEFQDKINEQLDQINQLKQQREKLEQQIETRTNSVEDIVKALYKRQDEVKRATAALIEELHDKSSMQEKNLDTLLKNYYANRREKYEEDLQFAIEEMQRAADHSFEEYQSGLIETLTKLQDEINDWYAKREAINQEILRQRELNEKQDFYRICIADIDLQDIAVLRDIKPRLGRSVYLDKIIYDNYVSKYVKEMTKRVLGGNDPSGIYKVTNIITQEIYIGKSTTVATRWTNHVKSAYGLDGVADSLFQRALKKYGVENFTWELIEKVPKDKLTEREKYYIDFYGTLKYGYNQRNG